MSYRRNQYDSNRDDDRYSKPYSRRNNYQSREETAYVAKEYSKKNTDQEDNTYYGKNGHTEYVAKPKKEVNNSTNHDNVIKHESNQTQEIYVPKNAQRKSGEGSTLGADNIAKQGHEERKTQQREKKPKREPQEHRGKEENNNTQEMYVPKKGQRKSGEGTALAADNVNNEGHEERKTQQREKKPKRDPQEHRIKEENGHPQEMYVPKKGQRKSGEGSNLAAAGDANNQASRAPKKDHKKSLDSNGQASEDTQTQAPKNKTEGHEGQKGQYKEKKPKREPHEQDVKEEKDHKPPKQKPAKDYNQAAPNNQKQEGFRIERNSDKTVERDTYQYDESLIAEITTMLHQACLEIPEQAFEKPKEENKAPVVEQNQAQESKPVEENKGDKVEVEKKEEPKNRSPEKAKSNQQKEQPPKKEKIKALDWISKEFYAIYHKKRNFFELYKQLEKFWEEVHETFEDEQATYKCFAKIKPNFVNSFAVYVILLFHVLTEKQLLEEAVDWFYQHKKFVEKEDQFGPIIFDAVQELEQKYVKSSKNGIARRVQKKILDAVNLDYFNRKIEDVNVIDKFDKSGKRFIRVGALEKIKKEDKIAVHFERNEHLREYLATIQIATRNEVFILDLERICKFEDNLLALVEFFTFILSRRSAVVIVMDAKELCQAIIDTMFMEKEKDNKDFVEKKRELCQVLGRYENHFTDLSKVGVGKNIREVFKNVLDVKLDQRQRYGDWYWRPLTEDQINTAAIEACGLFACYDKLFEENLGAEAQP